MKHQLCWITKAKASLLEAGCWGTDTDIPPQSPLNGYGQQESQQEGQASGSQGTSAASGGSGHSKAGQGTGWARVWATVASEVSPGGPYQLQEMLLSFRGRLFKIAINVLTKQSTAAKHRLAISDGADDSCQADGVWYACRTFSQAKRQSLIKIIEHLYDSMGWTFAGDGA